MTPTDDMRTGKIFFNWFDPVDYEKSRQKNHEAFKQFFNDIAALYFPEKSVSDINIFEPGCGTGRLLNIWKQLGANVSGCDASKKMVDYCNTKYFLTNVFQKEIKEYIPSDRADLIYTLLFFHLNNDWELIVKHCFDNVLKTDGSFFLLHEDSPYFSLVTGHYSRYFDIDKFSVEHPILRFFEILSDFRRSNGLPSLAENYPGPYLPSKIIDVLISKGYSVQNVSQEVKWDVKYDMQILMRDLRSKLMSMYRDFTPDHLSNLLSSISKNINANETWLIPHKLYAWRIQRRCHNIAPISLKDTHATVICSTVNIREQMDLTSEKDLEKVIETNLEKILSHNKKLVYCSLSYFSENKRYVGFWTRIPEIEISEWWQSILFNKSTYISLTHILAVGGKISPSPTCIYWENNGKINNLAELFAELAPLDLDSEKMVWSISKTSQLFHLLSVLLGHANLYAYGFTLPIHFHTNLIHKDNGEGADREELASCFLISFDKLSDGEVAQLALCLTGILMKKYVDRSKTGIKGLPYIVSTLRRFNDLTLLQAEKIRKTVFPEDIAHDYKQIYNNGNDQNAQKIMQEAKKNRLVSGTYEFNEIVSSYANEIIQALLLKALSRRSLWVEKTINKWHPFELLLFLEKELSYVFNGSASFDSFKKALASNELEKVYLLLEKWDPGEGLASTCRVSGRMLFDGIRLIHEKCTNYKIDFQFVLNEKEIDGQCQLWLMIDEKAGDVAKWKDSFVEALAVESSGVLSGNFALLKHCLNYGNPEVTKSKKIYQMLMDSYSDAYLREYSIIILNEKENKDRISFSILLRA